MNVGLELMPGTQTNTSVPPEVFDTTLMLGFCTDGGPAHEEYLTIQQVAERLSLTPKTIRNKMASGIFKRGTHYFSRDGMGPRFKWNAVKAWLESEDNDSKADVNAADTIPMSRGYNLGRPQRGGTKLAH